MSRHFRKVKVTCRIGLGNKNLDYSTFHAYVNLKRSLKDPRLAVTFESHSKCCAGSSYSPKEVSIF